MGFQSAGEAIMHSLRTLAIQNRSYPILITGNLIGVSHAHAVPGDLVARRGARKRAAGGAAFDRGFPRRVDWMGNPSDRVS